MKYLAELEPRAVAAGARRLSAEEEQKYIDWAYENMKKVDVNTKRKELVASIHNSHSLITELPGAQAFCVFRLIREYGLTTLYVFEFHAVPGFQGQGRGTRLMEQVIQLARTLQVQCIQLTVFKSNTRAVQFYRRWGFTHAKWSPMDEDEGYNYYIFILRLDEKPRKPQGNE